jgi:hypothetical protein
MAEAAPRADFDPEELLRRLTAAGVDFVVVGGIAATLHGSRRLTDDLDICYATDAENLEALGAVLMGLNARLWGVEEPLPFVPDAQTLSRVQLLTLETDAGRLDVMTRPDGSPPYEELRAGAERMELGGGPALVASIDHLIAMKQASDRDQDRADVATLEAARRLRMRASE